MKESAADSIAAVAFFIESKGLPITAERFADEVYDYFIIMADKRKSYSICREPERAMVGYKCLTYKKRYTIVFLESETELIICEFLPSKLLRW